MFPFQKRQHSSVRVRTDLTVIPEQEKYKKKLVNLRHTVKDMLFENAALCDQVALMQEKVIIVKEERNFLFKKLQSHQGITDTGKTSHQLQTNVILEGSFANSAVKKLASKKRTNSDVVKFDGIKGIGIKTVKKTISRKKLVNQVPLDSTGRPIFPIQMEDFTVHSLGEVVSNRPSYYTESVIYPVGYCSTRMYGSLKDPEKQCIYTCKVMDGGASPRFEIVSDTNLEVPLVSDNIDESHSLLLSLINQCLSVPVLETRGHGADFFGLSHPTVQYLIQSSPGVRKCHGYVWTKFEVSRSSSYAEQNDPTLHYDALLHLLMRSAVYSDSNITSLTKQEPEEYTGEDNVSTFRNILLN